MKISTKTILCAASLVAMGSSAYAQDAAPAPTWSLAGSIAGQSDYRFRGISQSDRNPVPQGALNLTGPDGFYVGTWLSQINWQANGVNENPGIEWDIYAGKHFDLGGSDLNVEAYEYAYPDYQALGTKPASYFEGIFTLSHTFGPVALDAVYAVSPEFSLGSGMGNYIEGQTVMTLTDWLTASANIGHQWVDAAPTDYTHADVGVTASYKGFALDLRYLGTDLNKSDCGFYMATKNACSAGFAATLSYNIALLP